MSAARSAYNLIDMTRHSGEHPRIGALVIEDLFYFLYVGYVLVDLSNC